MTSSTQRRNSCALAVRENMAIRWAPRRLNTLDRVVRFPETPKVGVRYVARSQQPRTLHACGAECGPMN
jgi:hypothetical protein